MKNAWVRKLASFALCAVMVFAAGAYGIARFLPTVAEEAAGLSVDNASPAPGGTFTVTVSFPAMQEQFDAADLKVRFDKTLVEATEVTATLIPGAVPHEDTGEGPVETIVHSDPEEANDNAFFSASYYAEGGDPVDFPGVTLTATFKVKETVAVGTVVTFTADTNDFYISRYDPDEFEDVDITPAGTVKSVTVTVTEAPAILYGDANGDGKIDGRDITRLRKYFANYNDDTETSTVEIGLGADANGDGKIDGRDITRLRKYFANYDDDTGTSTVRLGPQ